MVWIFFLRKTFQNSSDDVRFYLGVEGEGVPLLNSWNHWPSSKIHANWHIIHWFYLLSTIRENVKPPKWPYHSHNTTGHNSHWTLTKNQPGIIPNTFHVFNSSSYFPLTFCTEKLNSLPEVTHMQNVGARIWTHSYSLCIFLFPEPGSDPLVLDTETLCFPTSALCKIFNWLSFALTSNLPLHWSVLFDKFIKHQGSLFIFKKNYNDKLL